MIASYLIVFVGFALNATADSGWTERQVFDLKQNCIVDANKADPQKAPAIKQIDVNKFCLCMAYLVPTQFDYAEYYDPKFAAKRIDDMQTVTQNCTCQAAKPGSKLSQTCLKVKKVTKPN